jgi:DNA polymerase III subunit delta
MAKSSAQKAPSVVVIFGDEAYQKSVTLEQTLDGLLPADADRSLAVTAYDATQNEDQGGPSFAAVMDDLATLPFLTDRRIVIVREADRFITAFREKLERYLAAPSPTGTLILECRSFPKTTRLYKAVAAVGGQVLECRKLTGRALAGFVVEEAGKRAKRMDAAAAGRLCELIGQDLGLLASEVEKLSLYVGERQAITAEDVSELVGQSREEKIFRVMDLAGLGRLPEALSAWHQVLATDPAAIYKALGGMAFVLRRWLDAQQLRAGGTSIREIAPRMMMWGRERELEGLLTRLTPGRLTGLLAGIGELDSQAKSGRRSIETGVEELLFRVAAPSA